jgi:integrase/recombinase XerD
VSDPEALLSRYRNWMSSVDRADKTMEMRLRIAAQVLEHWPDPNETTTADLTEWLGGMRNTRTGEPLSRWSRATYHSSVRAFFKWLALTEAIERDPTVSELFERPRPPKGVPKPLSPGEEATVLRAARGNTRAWLLLALRAGFRAHEVAKVRGDDVNEDYVYVKGKGGKEAFIETHPDLWELAQGYPRRGWWFPSPKHDGHISGDTVTIMTGALFRRAGIPSGSIHRARHTFATTLMLRGVDIRTVQELMRHESLTTTALYTAVDSARRRAAISLLGDTA